MAAILEDLDDVKPPTAGQAIDAVAPWHADARVHPQGLRSSAHCLQVQPRLALQVLRHSPDCSDDGPRRSGDPQLDFVSVEGARRAARRHELTILRHRCWPNGGPNATA